MSINGYDRSGYKVICTRRKETGTCDHRRQYSVAKIEAATLGGLRDNLLSGPALDLFLKSYRAERKRLAGESVGRRRELEHRLSGL